MNDSQRRHRSAIGKGNFLVAFLLAITIGSIQYFFLASTASALLAVLVVGLFFSILYFNISYHIEGHQLKVSSLFSTQKIDVFQISSLQKVNSYLQQPFAFSEKRIRIIYNYGEYIDVSPQQAEEFAEELLAINPMIQHQIEPSLQE